MTKFLLGLIIMVFSTSSAAAQLKQRTIEDGKPYNNSPVTIVDKRWKTSALNPGRYITADKNWLKDVLIDIKNVSDKPIMAVDVFIIVEQKGGMKQPFSLPMLFRAAQEGPTKEMRPLRPGSTFTLTVSERHRLWGMEFLTRYQQEDFGNVKIEIQDVAFMDGTRWTLGRRMRQNPNNPDEWSPIRETNQGRQDSTS